MPMAVTVYVSGLLTVMDLVVAPPGDHVLPERILEVSTTEPPPHKFVEPLADILTEEAVPLIRMSSIRYCAPLFLENFILRLDVAGMLPVAVSDIQTLLLAGCTMDNGV